VTLIAFSAMGYHILNKPIKDNNYTKMTIYLNWNKNGAYEITEKRVITNFIKKINSSPKKDISKIVFEQGPNGRIIFEGKNSVYEVKVFSDGGNIVTNNHYILTEFNLVEIIKKE
jgi:hypothetical protein